MPVDSFNRRIDYLRLSVTDRCNLRCLYCLPEFYARFAPAEELLSDSEIEGLAACFAALGVSKIRVTGGEPLVRPAIADLISRLAKLPGVAEVSLSTNGMLLAPLARELAQAGLRRVNISLDTLRPERFRQITRFGKLAAVLDGIEAALKAGLNPVKLNVVVARGMNADEIGAFVELTRSLPLHVRFIELMPMGETGFFSEERRVSLQEMLERAAPLKALCPEERPLGHGPARYYRRPGAEGTVGFISPLSCGFCSSCNRVRLTARGVLVPCLDASEGTDLRQALRDKTGRAHLQSLILSVIEKKPRQHSMLERAAGLSPNPRFMCQIGG